MLASFVYQTKMYLISSLKQTSQKSVKMTPHGNSTIGRLN